MGKVNVSEVSGALMCANVDCEIPEILLASSR